MPKMSLFTPSLSSLWRQIEDTGLDPEALFLRHGIEKTAIFDNNARVSGIVVDRIMADAAQETADPFFGMKEAEYFRPAHLGPLGFAWLASNNLLEALSRLQRYARVINDRMAFELDEDGERTVITPTIDEPSLNPFHRDTGLLAVLVRMCRFLCGQQWNPQRVALSHPQPKDSSHFFAFFRCPVDFDSSANSLHISTAAAREPITGANEYLAQLNDHIVVRYLAHQSREDVVNRTRAAILDSLSDGKATEKAVADMLHLSPRQLNRRLNEEGTSFRELLVECRRELAEQYISDGTLSLTEISFLLGFAEASSFSRAFRRWTGLSPTEARESAAQKN
jgi:AraC-like DNA-binding protein